MHSPLRRSLLFPHATNSLGRSSLGASSRYSSSAASSHAPGLAARPASHAFLENPADREYNSEYLGAAMETGDVSFLHHLQATQRSQLPKLSPSSSRQQATAQLKRMLTELGWGDEAYDLAVKYARTERGILRASWLEYQVYQFVAAGEAENGLRLFAFYMQNLESSNKNRKKTPAQGPTLGLVVFLTKTIHERSIRPPMSVQHALTSALSSLSSPLSALALPKMVSVYQSWDSLHSLRVIVEAWTSSASASAMIKGVSDAATAVIGIARETKDYKSATAWYKLHRELMQSASSKLSSPENTSSPSPSSPQPYLAYASFLLARAELEPPDADPDTHARRPWRTMSTVLAHAASDGVEPSAGLYALGLRVARESKRYDRAFGLFALMREQGKIDQDGMCTVWKCVDDTRKNGSLYHRHAARPSATELFRVMIELSFLSGGSPRWNSEIGRGDGPLTTKTLSLALRHFVHAQSYVQALLVLRTSSVVGFELTRAAKWDVECTILRRGVMELKRVLDEGLIGATEDGGQGEEADVWCWAEYLMGLDGVVPVLETQRGTPTRWKDVKSSDAYLSRLEVLDVMEERLRVRMQEGKPGFATPLADAGAEAGIDAEDTPTLETLAALLARCALASVRMSPSAPAELRQETLEGLMRDAEVGMMPLDPVGGVDITFGMDGREVSMEEEGQRMRS